MNKIIKKFRLKKWLGSFFKTPARLSVTGFLILVLTGTVFLMLPVSSKEGSLGFIDALFTSTSASCVTGLSVINVYNSLSTFGQIVLLCLIQIGGLGIMTISTLLVIVVGGRAKMAEKKIITDTFSHSAKKPVDILKSVIILTLIFEAAGAFILYLRFLFIMPPLKALYFAIFHSVSAFCNAGFALFNNSLSDFTGDFVVNAVVTTLIIAGGLGFLVIFELKNNYEEKRFHWKRLSIHTKLVIITSLVLIIAGTLMVLAFEWNNTLKGFSFGDKLIASYFQSVSLRTAGFNTIDISHLTGQVIFLSMFFMFIGASPGSCGGGIKTTTIATLFLLGYNRIRGNMSTSFSYRKIPEESVTKAVNILVISIFIVLFVFILFLMTEITGSPKDTRGYNVELLFEIFSAFGTVGLSTGITDSLSNMGRLLITILMFVGRLGPIMIGIAISRNISSKYEYAEENIMVG